MRQAYYLADSRVHRVKKLHAESMPTLLIPKARLPIFGFGLVEPDADRHRLRNSASARCRTVVPGNSGRVSGKHVPGTLFDLRGPFRLDVSGLRSGSLRLASN
jgi:hypothetical protein